MYQFQCQKEAMEDKKKMLKIYAFLSVRRSRLQTDKTDTKCLSVLFFLEKLMTWFYGSSAAAPKTDVILLELFVP